MVSPSPLQYGQHYHIYNRGNNRENIFFEERNYRYFLELYTKYIEPVADTFAYCLLPNHFHFSTRIKTIDEQQAQTFNTLKVLRPSQQFSNLFNAYAKAINKAYGRTGSLFQNPFGRIPVNSNAYFMRLITYIHQNPQKHGLVDDFRIWTYSSYQALLSKETTRIKRDEVLTWFNGVDDLKAAHRQEVANELVAALVVDDFD